MKLWDAFIKAGRTTYIYSISAMNRKSAKRKADKIAADLYGRVEKILVQRLDDA